MTSSVVTNAPFQLTETKCTTVTSSDVESESAADCEVMMLVSVESTVTRCTAFAGRANMTSLVVTNAPCQSTATRCTPVTSSDVESESAADCEVMFLVPVQSTVSRCTAFAGRANMTSSVVTNTPRQSTATKCTPVTSSDVESESAADYEVMMLVPVESTVTRCTAFAGRANMTSSVVTNTPIQSAAT